MRIIITYVIQLCLVLCPCLTYDVKDSPGVTFNASTYDFGDFYLGDGPRKCVFKLTNTGTVPLSIVSITSSCSCTSTYCENKYIVPGEHTSIEVVYKNNDGPYPFKKTIAVYTSLSEQPHFLYIRGNVLRKPTSPLMMYRARSRNLGFIDRNVVVGRVKNGEFISDSLRVYNFSRRESLLSISSPLFHFDNKYYKIPPKSYVYIPYFATVPDTLVGNACVPIYILNCSDDKKSEMVLSVNFQVIPKMQDSKATTLGIQGRFINLGTILRKEDRIFHISLNNKSGNPLYLRKVETPRELVCLSPVSSTMISTSQTVIFELLDNKHKKGGNVATAVIYSNSREVVDYVYVSYYIPGIVERLWLIVKKHINSRNCKSRY